VERGAALVQLPLPASAYAHAAQPSLQDLRIVDARGERVPFAVLAPRAPEPQSAELQRAATLYPLPPKPAAGGVWPSPVEIQVQGDRVSVTSRGKAASSAAGARSGGWLFDLGERQRDDPPPHSLRVQWSSPTEFAASFSFETSDDLRSWRRGGYGQLMALSATAGPLTQPLIVLPANAGRFVRLVWADAANAPTLTTAHALSSQPRSRVLDAPAELIFAASAQPVGKSADAPPAGALHFDLGGVLPLVQLELRLPAGTRVVPAQVQGRNRVEDPWRELAASVFYRLEREGNASVSPPLALRTSARYLRIVPDARGAALDAQQTQLVVQAQLASLVFAAQGQAPYVLLAGSSDAARSALPLATLVPSLDDERARFGRSSLGPWSEVAAVARAQEVQQKLATLRPLLLWAVLLAGVAALGFMVWRLARDKPSNA
ncbi:MAG TPA: DUF3999 family protein, partial [Burkholderiaceae bacterium]|nr:DUF3999 family protein [Burkholderiaceae bacterium]